MLKRTHFLLAVCSVILAACGGKATATPTASAALPVETATPAATTAAVPDCTVVSFIPTPDPAVSALIPDPGADDWVLGPNSASVTIIEYSDFQ